MHKYRIGLILGTKDTDYPRQIRMGVQNTLEDEGLTLVNLADLIPYHTHTRTAQYMRAVFGLAKRIDLDAVIVPLGTLFGYLESDVELTNQLIHSLDPAKTIVLERDVEGYRCVTKDGRPGMQQCMRHLIDDCGLTRIAFVSGPETSAGARQREGVYFEEMAAHGLAVEDGYFKRGQFSGVCDEVIHEILDEHPDIEAIACATDLIAFTCYRILRERGYAVGEDIAVTGFDDHPSAAHIDPPLSTVRVTGYELGCTGAREAVRLCRGLAQQESILNSVFIPRGSCGEDRIDDVTLCSQILAERPFPYRKIAEILADETLVMAGASFARSYTDTLEKFVRRVTGVYERHLQSPEPTDRLFSSRDFYTLFPVADFENLSLEGFHGRVVCFLEALSKTADRDESIWIGSQISELHLHAMRTQSSMLDNLALRRDKREYFSFRVAEDALLQEHDDTGTHRLILEELRSLGIEQADIFLLEDTIPVSARNSIPLSDSITHIASLHEGTVTTPNAQVSLLTILSDIEPLYGDPPVITFAPLMAGLELVGIIVLHAPHISDNGQLMAILDVSVALKLLEMFAIEREMNEILNRNNLLLERESTHDEMTGILNRRGLMEAMIQTLNTHPDEQAVIYYFDLDGLKYINDHLGHEMGDDAIKTAAHLISQSLPPECLVGRMGGDEFVAFALVSDKEEAHGLMDGVERAFGNPKYRNGATYTLSISCGMHLVSREGDARDRISDSLTIADTHMYAMKAEHHESRCFRATRPSAS